MKEKLPYAKNFRELIVYKKAESPAEAWGKRMYLKHFVAKLSDAEAELNETEH